MLKAKNICVDINNISIINDASIHIPKGVTVGLIGRNGAGKTTIIKSLMGLLPIKNGELIIDGKDFTTMPPNNRAKFGIGYLPEDRRLIPDFNVEENIVLPLSATKKENGRERMEMVYDIMPEIARFANRKALSLSGGQQKLVALARAMVVGENLLLLDEPFEGVAPVLAKRLLEIISALKKEGLSVLLSESDNVHSEDILDRFYTIERGKVELKES